MISPVLQNLLDKGGASLVDESSLDTFVQQQTHSILFFAGDVTRFPESNDLAVILPELAKAFAGQFQIGLVSAEAESALQQQYGFNQWPSLVVLRGNEYLGTISQLQNWANYCADIDGLLKATPSRPPGLGMPVINQSSSCA